MARASIKLWKTYQSSNKVLFLNETFVFFNKNWQIFLE